MLRSKLDIDKHVENCLKKIHSQAERNQRYFSFARLYFNIGEYEQAQRYLSSYLSTKPKSAEGYHLFGKTLEKLGKKDAALEAYRTSLQLDPKQNNLVIKVCELLAADDVNLDQSGARYFCEMAQSFDPTNPSVFSLKERLIMTENKNPHEVSNLLLKELEDRPTDVNLRIRLLQHFLHHNMIQEAYKHVCDIENRNLNIFTNNIKWYEVVAEILVRYQRDTSHKEALTWQFWFISVSVMDKLVTLSLDERSDNVKLCSDYVNTVFNFDQTLQKASQNIDSCPDRQLAQEFLTHYRGQLCFHLITFIHKQAKKDLIKFKDARNITLPVLFAAFHIQPVDLQSLWVVHSTEERRNMVQRWNREASFRCSQVGHMLLSLAKDRKMTLIEKAQQYSSGVWRESFYKKAFITRDQQIKMNTSYFVTCPQLIDITFRLPDISELLAYDEVAQLVYPDSLHHHIWIALNHKLSDLPLSAFEGLQYSVKNLGTCAAESLSILDIQAFIYCATLCAQSQLAEMKNVIYYNPDKPQVLPAALTEQLGTNNQAKFLSAAYKLYKNETSADFGELRLFVIKGLEVVRCVGHHGLDVKLLVMLANIFAERSKKLSKQSQDHSMLERTRKVSAVSEIEYNDQRAELYWKTALPLLEKLKNNQAISYSNNRWFEYKAKDMSIHEICGYIEKGKLFAAVQLMKKKELDKALKIFEGLRDPYASFYQAQIYKQMADQITSHNKENLTSEMRSQHIIVLSRARDCLYLTLDRLREPSVDRNHPLNSKLGTEIENIERLLSRIDPDCINRNECDGMSDENVSSADSAGEHYVTGYSLHQSSYLNNTFPHRHDTHNIHSTPLRADLLRREARPSPERLDAQLRQLAATKDASISHILEQNKVMVESHKSLVEELRSFKDAVYNLTSTVDDLKTMKQGFQELKEVKKAVNELKASVDELQNFKNITDVVYEMKREIADLKKDVSTAAKPNQLSDEDLCILDNEYGSDYNIPHAVTPSYNQNLYPNYQGRLPGTYGALYPSLYSPMAAYAYGGLSLPQAGALAFSPEQQMAADLRAIQLGQVPGPGAAYGQPLHTPAPALAQALVQPIVTPGTMPPAAGLSSLGQPLLSQVTSSAMSFPKPPAPPGTTTTAVASSALYPPMGAPSVTPLITPSSGSATAGLLSGNRAPPVNVVITSSDPLPSSLTPVPQKPLSVTIPPQHLKGNLQAKQQQQQQLQQLQQPHNYQIPLPSTGITTSVTPSILSKPPPIVSTQSLLSNVAPPMYSAIGEKDGSKNVTLGLEIEKTLDKTFALGKSDASEKSSPLKLNLSNISNTSLEEHDPCPDFKPIIPLPDEVPLHTGEEDEVVLFAEKTKLFRWSVEKDVKEWKERGVGILKILHNPKTNNVRLVMRRDQVHKICANHFLTADMMVAPMTNNEKAYTWAAQDFADEQLHTEKFCARFKSPDEAKRFFEAFQNAQKILKDKQRDQKESSKPTDSPAPSVLIKSLTQPKASTPPVFGQASVISKPSGTSLGGFVFTSTPTFEPKRDTSVSSNIPTTQEPTKSPFSGLSFVKQPTTNFFSNLELKICKPNVPSPKPSEVTVTVLNKSSNEDANVDDFEPTVEFKPVIPLPELVEVKTGEENAQVLFESRAKLLRYDTSGPAPEWKERGLGTMKVLKDNIVRLVMRREQVHKVCCNHQVTKAMKFQKMASNPKAVTWCAQDFSEGTIKAETFALRFKTEELADEFLKTILIAQSTMDDSKTAGNDSAEETIEKPGKHIKSDPAKHVKSDPAKTDLNSSGSKQTGFGDKFKPSKGSWECKICYIVNDGKANYCMACDSPKNNTIPPKSATSETSGSSFSFGISTAAAPTAKFSIVSPQTTNTGTPKTTFPFSSPSAKAQVALPDSTTTPTKAVQWGDKFKPAAGSWECQACFVRNNADVLYCLSCESPKDSTVSPKESSTIKGISLDTGGQKFSFGIPSTAPATKAPVPATTGLAFGQPTAPLGAQFTFGMKTLQPASNNAPSLFSNTSSTFSFTKSTLTAVELEKKDTGASGDKFVFGSPQKHDFGFMARSPRHNSSGQGDDDSDGSYEEEADNIYFKPVIPLPDKVEVVTGEEGEEVLYCHRAKLFRYLGGEWKERGLGDIKILRNKQNGRLRVVMRREQVLKICLNHILTASIEYTAKDDKTWLFSAPDFSEGEIQRNQFCIRFKNPEIALDFKKAVSNAVGSHSNESEEDKVEIVEVEDDSDVEFISETKVTPEEEKEALRLGLPAKFMAYRQLPDCTCDQCKKDDEYLGPTRKDSAKSTSRKASTPFLRASSPATSPFTTPLSTVATPSTEGSVFGTPQDQSSMWSTSTNSVPSSSPSLKSLLIKPPQFSVAKSEPEHKSPLLGSGSTLFSSPMFATVAPPKSTPDAPTSASVTMSGNLFGPKPATTNLFGSIPAPPVKSEPGSSPFSFSAPKLSSTFGAVPTPPSTVPTTFSTLFNSNVSILSNSQAKPTEPAAATTTASSSIFSTSTLATTNVFNTSGSLFGVPTGTQKPGSIFGTSTNVFGNGKAFSSNSSIFGENKNPPSATPVFGASVFTSTTTQSSQPTTQPMFGMAQVSIVEKPSIFGSPVSAEQVKPIFKIALSAQDKGAQDDSKGESKPFTFATKDAPQKTDGAPTGGKPGDDVVLKCDNTLSFATLAAKTSENAAPAFAKPADDKTPFAFLGAGTPVFASQQKKTMKSAKNESMEGEEGGEYGAEEDYDPHYEPIVPLPEAIVVSTGEEDELVEFNERAKLYRYDTTNKEWKERGVGQMKILHHPMNRTYRFLMRREQVHKVVLNQLLTPEVDMQPMATSDKAWMWAGYNYTDDGCNLEQLAIRFKNCELARHFYEVVQQVLASVREIQANRSLPSMVQNYGIDDVSSPEVSQVSQVSQVQIQDVSGNQLVGDCADEEDEGDDDDERSIIFSRRCLLKEEDGNGQWKEVAEGEVSVYYDPEFYAYRISVTKDDGESVSNTLIGMNTVMHIEGKECTWHAVEWVGQQLHWRRLKVIFSSEDYSQEFYANYEDGVHCANQCNILDELPTGNSDESEE